MLSGAAWDLGGAVVLGCVLGAPAAYLTGRLKPGEPLQAEAIGIVFLVAGFALWLEVSFLVAGMTAGAVIGAEKATELFDMKLTRSGKGSLAGVTPSVVIMFSIMFWTF